MTESRGTSWRVTRSGNIALNNVDIVTKSVYHEWRYLVDLPIVTDTNIRYDLEQ